MAPGRHALSEQTSPTVQALSSEQVAVFGRCTQPVWALQESSLHGLPSSQVPSSVRPLQLSSMPLQTSGTTTPGWQLAVQTLPLPLVAGAQMPDAQSARTVQGQPIAPPQLVSGLPSAVLASAMSAVSAVSAASRVSAVSAASGSCASAATPSDCASPIVSGCNASVAITASDCASSTIRPS